MTGKEAPPSEQEGQQRPCEVQPLVAVVIPVVQLSSAESSQQQPVDHVPENTVINSDIQLSRRVRWHSPIQVCQVALTLRSKPSWSHKSH